MLLSAPLQGPLPGTVMFSPRSWCCAGSIAASWQNMVCDFIREVRSKRSTKNTQEAESIMLDRESNLRRNGFWLCFFFFFNYSKQKWIEGREEEQEQLKNCMMAEVACMLQLQPAFLIKSHFGFLYSSVLKRGFNLKLDRLIFQDKNRSVSRRLEEN